MRKKKTALFYSVVSLLLCVSMLMGTTFAWFTDSVSSANNRIAAGNLDVELEYYADGRWNPVTETTNVFNKDAHWEPGYTEVVYLRISNAGDLALKYQLGINVAAETMSINTEGDSFALSDHIVYGVVRGVKPSYAGRDDARNAVTAPTALSSGYTQQDSILPGGEPHYVALVVFMPENVSNAANHAAGVEAPRIELGIKLFATQEINESDSFGNGYDATAGYPKKKVNVSVAVPVRDNAENGVMVDSMTVGNTASGMSAEIPAGVTLADGADALTLSVKTMEQSKANIELQQGEVKTSLDVHMDGVAEDNSVPMLITLENYLPTGLNEGNVKLYHVEDDGTKTMTGVGAASDVDLHNEFYYEPSTGDVTMALATFSEVAVVADTTNPWNGGIDTGWYNTTATEFTLTTADQLAGFGAIVDGTAENIAADNFEGKTVKLGADINLGGTVSFDPIGCGYAREGINSDNVEGKTFNGTFDGQGHTISGLYQNGWALGLQYCNLGGGLFASVVDATIQNLTVSGADIVMECVEMGVLVGLSQGDCTYNNINIHGCKIANYQRATGGLIGEVSPKYENGQAVASAQIIQNVTIGSDVVVGSLWGDFDAPVGGVIGARWDDSNVTTVEMKNVDIACRLDVYNDVTSTYQWYAYRRAGMLIGNTDTPPADGKNAKTATADFLECEGVIVRYGSWVNYHYCQFTNYKASWPWVRVEAGENCSAYSNPRYGVPNDAAGNKVVDMDHKHLEGDECYVELKFNQLYGGGQGVYGQAEHDGVTVNEYLYAVYYVNDGKLLDTKYVMEANLNPDGTFNTINSTAQEEVQAWATKNGYTNVTFGGWMNAGSTKLAEIPAGNDKDVMLYPYFNDLYTASFVDQQGNILAWCLFNVDDTSKLDGAKAEATNKLPAPDEGFELQYWEVQRKDSGGNVIREEYDKSKFAGYATDVTIYPHYSYNGDVNLIPVDSDGDGDTDYYQVGGYGATTGEQELVVIPDYVNGIPVTSINAGAFKTYADLHSVVIPANVTEINSQSFADFEGWQKKRQTITLYYEGTPEQWASYMNLMYNDSDTTNNPFSTDWDNAMGEGSCVFFLVDGKVDLSKGYWELANTSAWYQSDKFEWQHHNHPYQGDRGSCGNEHNNSTNYAGTCDCDSCNGATRPDATYWKTDETA